MLMATAVPERIDEQLSTDLDYLPDDPVMIHVIRRGRRIDVSDDGAAVARAGRPRGWRVAADKIDREFVVNVSRSGVVSLPVVAVGPGLEAIKDRIAAASLALYEELLELEATS
jgi:hypothetical protein